MTATLALVDDLLTCPYPDAGYHAVDLRISDDFCDDETSGAAATATWEQFEADRAQLVAALTDRWGHRNRPTCSVPAGRAPPWSTSSTPFTTLDDGGIFVASRNSVFSLRPTYRAPRQTR